MINPICTPHYSTDPITTIVAFQTAIKQAKEYAGRAAGSIGLEAIKKEK